MKIRNDRPDNKNGNRHFKDAFEFTLRPDRTIELKEFIKNAGMKFQKDCRFSFIGFSHKRAKQNGYYNQRRLGQPAIISFRTDKQALMFKLAWNECESVRLIGITSGRDGAFYYAPYIPLIMTSAIHVHPPIALPPKSIFISGPGSETT